VSFLGVRARLAKLSGNFNAKFVYRFGSLSSFFFSFPFLGGLGDFENQIFALV